MPQYELMYILSSAVPDTEEPTLTQTITEFISQSGGKIIKEEKLGRKRMAYPIKNTRNGFYVLIEFFADADKVNAIEHKVRVTQGVIRHMIVKLDEMLARMEKDRKERSLFKKPFRSKESGEPGSDKPRAEINIDLDKQIEKALEEDVVK